MHKALPLLLLAAPVPAEAAQSAVVAASTHGRGHSSVMVTVPFGRSVRINDLVVRPVSVLEDSRCPAEVQCAWAGNMRVSFATAGRSNFTLELGRPLPIAGGRLTLLSAEPRRTKAASPAPKAYVFTLRFERP
jgi:hypothetical protein